MANISHRHISSASLRTIDLVYPQAILPMRVTLFPSGALCVTNIPPITCENTFCSELNGKRAGESFMSLRFIVFFKICSCKVEKLSISRKFDLWPIITDSNIDL